MRPIRVTLDSETASNWIPVNYRQNSFIIGFAVTLSAGAVLTYSVQHTFDDVYDPAVTPVAFDHEFVAGETTSEDGNYSAPIMAMRLNVTAYTSGTATLTILQGH